MKKRKFQPKKEVELFFPLLVQKEKTSNGKLILSGMPKIMIPAKDAKTGKQILVDFNSLQPSDQPRHEYLPASLLERIKILHKKIEEVHFASAKEFEEAMRREAHPESEVNAFECIAETYKEYTTGKSISLEKKKHIYSAIIFISWNNPKQDILKSCPLVTVNDLLDLMNLWKSVVLIVKTK